MKKISDLHGKNMSWTDFHKMGLSVACLYDYMTGDTHVYLDDNKEELVHRLNKADLVVGYNIIAFDNKLVRASCANPLPEVYCYDILLQVRKSTGQPMPKGCNLNNVLEATFGMQKTEDGADAPLFYQRGEKGKVISYCLSDVRRERM